MRMFLVLFLLAASFVVVICEPAFSAEPPTTDWLEAYRDFGKWVAASADEQLKRDKEKDADKLADLQWMVALIEESPKLTGLVPCPAGVPTCECGCANGKPCTCANKSTWHPDGDGTGDYGRWLGETFIGRWYKADNTFAYWEGKKFGPRLPMPATAPAATWSMPTFGSCPNCVNGRCR